MRTRFEDEGRLSNDRHFFTTDSCLTPINPFDMKVALYYLELLVSIVFVVKYFLFPTDSFMTCSFMVESMAIANAILNHRAKVENHEV